MQKATLNSLRSIKEALSEVYKRFRIKYKKQGWWPVIKNGKLLYDGSNPKGREFEIAVGAILAQNTNWSNAEKALLNLYKNKVLNLKSIASIKLKELKSFIYPSGFYNEKAKKLKAFASFVMKSGGMNRLLKTKNLRDKLLGIYGIGYETADSIILYCNTHNEFIADTYTRRILSRLTGKKFDTYTETKEFFLHLMKSFNQKEFHAYFVRHAKEFCLKKPLCKSCFLNDICRQAI